MPKVVYMKEEDKIDEEAEELAKIVKDLGLEEVEDPKKKKRGYEMSQTCGKWMEAERKAKKRLREIHGTKYGRPLVINEEKLKILDECFSLGYTDEEACIFAEVTTGAFYKYCKKNPLYQRKKEFLKKTIPFNARKNLLSRVEKGDKDFTKWSLEKMERATFGNQPPSVNINLSNKIEINLDEE